MRLVFWQNCLSPHQLPYIVHLKEDPRVKEVLYVVGEEISQSRKDMGWRVMDFSLYSGEVSFFTNPDETTIHDILGQDERESVHLFSGIRAFSFVFRTFKESLKYKVRRGVITERPNTYAFGCANGKPLWLHWLRWKIQDGRFLHSINCVFAMGEIASHFFARVNSQWEVYPFGYCTYLGSASDTVQDAVNKAKCMQVAFVGSLSRRKSVDKLLISTTLVLSSNNGEIALSIIGDGPERQRLEQLVEKKEVKNVHFLGTQKQSDIPALLSSQDVLVLPSIYDGWGAVVNEALQQGLYVICSDKCGAQDLLKGNSFCGGVFRAGNAEDLAEKLGFALKHLDDIRADRESRRSWARNCISGKTMAHYMVDCLCGLSPQLPWRQ